MLPKYCWMAGCNYQIDRTWNDVWFPTKWRESSLRQTLQVHVNSVTQKIQSSDWLKWWCTFSHRHRMSFQVVCQYVNSLHKDVFYTTAVSEHWCMYDLSGEDASVWRRAWCPSAREGWVAPPDSGGFRGDKAGPGQHDSKSYFPAGGGQKAGWPQSPTQVCSVHE